MNQKVRRRDSHDAALNSASQVGLVLEVLDLGHLLSPESLREVPDHLHRHELTAVGAVVDEGDVVKFAGFLDLVCSVKAEVVEHKCTRSLCYFNESLDKRDEAFLVVALLPRLTEH